MKRQMKNMAVLVLSMMLAGGTLAAQETTIESLLSKDLVGTPGKELLIHHRPIDFRQHFLSDQCVLSVVRMNECAPKTLCLEEGTWLL